MSARKSRGFTVFQIIIIFAILTFQAIVLLPVIEAAREKDRKTACLNNLKECAEAVQLYWNDWDAMLPSSAITDSSPTDTQVVNFLTGIGAQWPPVHGTRQLTWPQILADYVRNQDVIFCPSDNSKTRASYWWKYSIDRAWRELKLKHEGNFYYPNQQILLYEHSALHTGDAAGIRNGVQINVAYMDDHVATVTIVNGPTFYPSATDERSGVSSIRLGEPMYYNYDNTNNSTHSGVADYVDPRRYSDKY